jgi:hypothetical protein
MYNIISVEDVLKRAHVPPRQGVYVERKVMIQKIRNELYKLKEQDGCELHCVFLHYYYASIDVLPPRFGLN